MKKAEDYDYEGEMAKNTLRKLVVFSNELLPMIKDDQQMPAWLQDKFSKLDYYINSVYSYMKFSNLEMNNSAPEKNEEDMSKVSEQMELEVNIEDVVKK